MLDPAPTADRILDSWEPTRALEAAIRREISDAAALKSVPAGTDLFHPSSTFSPVAIVGSGSLRAYALSDEGREITMYRTGPGEMCSSSLASALGGGPHSGHVVAETDVELVVLPAARFRSWVDRSPSLRRHVFSLLTSHTNCLVDLIEALLLPLDRRLAGILLQGFGADHNLSATHVALAADAGTSREVASRYLKEFERSGAVDLGRGVIDLRDRSVLAALSEGRTPPQHEAPCVPSGDVTGPDPLDSSEFSDPGHNARSA